MDFFSLAKHPAHWFYLSFLSPKYLLHDSDGWEEIASYFDLKIFIDSDVDNCMDRLKIRNLAIPGFSLTPAAQAANDASRPVRG